MPSKKTEAKIPLEAEAQSVIEAMNFALKAIQEQLIKVQGNRKDGSIHLRLKDCGPTCNGCPHANFIIWKTRIARTGPTKGQAFLVRMDLKRPGKTDAARKPEVMALIKAAEDIMQMKSSILKTHKAYRESLRHNLKKLQQYV